MRSEGSDTLHSSNEVRFEYGLSPLVLCGILSLVGYGCLFLISPRFAYDVPQVERPLFLVITLFVAIFGVYLVAIRLATRGDGATVRCGLGFAIAFRAMLLFSEPIQEVDIYRYLWDGLVVRHGVSPFAYTPQTVLDCPVRNDLPDDLQRLVRLRDSSDGIGEVLDRVHYQFLPTVYPPVSQAVFATAAWMTPGNASLATRVGIMKLVLLLFDVGTIIVVILTLRRAGVHEGWSLAYAWCPLVVKEYSNSGHLDAIAVFLSASAIYCALVGLFPQRAYVSDDEVDVSSVSVKRLLWTMGGAVLLGLAIGAKLYPVAFIPILAWSSVRKLGWQKMAAVAGVFLLVTSICIAPLFWPAHAGDGNPFAGVAAAQDRQAGLKAFLSAWMMNDLIFLSISENLTPDRLRADTVTPWFVVLPDTLRERMCEHGVNAINRSLSWLGGKPIRPDRFPFVVARFITALVFTLLAVWFAYHAGNALTADRWLELVFLSIAWFWLLLPTLNPWYWTWVLPWIAFARNRIWLGLSGLLFIYYARFYFESQPELQLGSYQGVDIFDYVIVWFEYIPWFVVLSACWFWKFRRQLSVECRGGEVHHISR